MSGWDIDSKLERAMDALQCPEPDAPLLPSAVGETQGCALPSFAPGAGCSVVMSRPTASCGEHTVAEAHLQQYKVQLSR